MQIENYNIVVAGTDLPVVGVTPEDYHFLGSPLRVQTRIPPLVDARAQEFRMLLTPIRAEFGVTGLPYSPENATGVAQIVQGYLARLEFPIVTGMGHNLRVSLEPDELPAESLLNDVIQIERIARILQVDDTEGGDVAVVFRHGDARCTVRLSISEQSLVRLDFNYHFAITNLANPIERLAILFLDSLNNALVRAHSLSTLAVEGIR